MVGSTKCRPRADLAEKLREESDRPGGLGELAPLLARPEESELATAFLKAKEEQLKAAWYVEAEPLWMRKLTWRLTRPLLVTGVLAAVGFSLQSALDPTLALSLFLLGAASLYVVQQVFTHLWARQDERARQRAERAYKDRLADLLARLEGAPGED